MAYLATQINDSAVVVFPANADTSDIAGKAVKLSSGKVVLCSTAGEAPLGVAIVTNDNPVKSGADVTIQIKDIGLVKAGGSFSAGAELTTDANGKFVSAATGNFVAAIALADGAAGNLVKAQIVKVGYKA